MVQMGNEKSQPVGLSIDETATEVTDSWTLHGATYSVGSIPKISVFITNSSGSLETSHLEKYSKNLMIYRHPCILKYIASWKKGLKFHLATEQIQPLAQVLPSQTSLQICVGLQNILKALTFLHESGSVSHNNVCRAAIYVTQGGSWKLGGLEYLCRFNEMSSKHLEETRRSRYDPAISPDEIKHLPQPLTAIDCYAFGILAQEVLTGKNTDDVPGLADFLELCKKQLQNPCSEARPSLNSLLMHPFFSHEFLAIHNFLIELPIKKENEKQEFFRILAVKLNSFPEDIVASQLGSLLLSRIVLLDPTAQNFLLANIFIPRKDDGSQNKDSLFSETTFRTHMVPRLLPLFCVRDMHIRLTLLSHFHSYCHLFSQVQLQSRILPELLVGIKDTCNQLVGETLRALAELVPLLGGAVVIGGHRAKLFADGRPNPSPSTAQAVKSSKLFNQKKTSKTEIALLPEIERSEHLLLTERPSPDGGEDIPALTTSEEDETWTDWDEKGPADVQEVLSFVPTLNANLEQTKALETIQREIKNVRLKEKPKVGDEFENIFREMEPVISKPQVIHIDEFVGSTLNKFALNSEVTDDVQGWEDDFDDWNDTESEIVDKVNVIT